MDEQLFSTDCRQVNGTRVAAVIGRPTTVAAGTVRFTDCVTGTRAWPAAD
jgi:hypothetical protein